MSRADGQPGAWGPSGTSAERGMGLPSEGEPYRRSPQLPFDVSRLLKQKAGPEQRCLLRDGSPGGEDSWGLAEAASRVAAEPFLLPVPARSCRPGSHGPPSAAAPKEKTRTVFSTRHILHLQAAFDGKHPLSGAERVALAHALHLTETQVKIWFQNRRNQRKRHVSLDPEGDPPAVLPLRQRGRLVPGAARTRSFSGADKVVFSPRVLSSAYTAFPPLCFTREAPSLVSFPHMLSTISASGSGTGSPPPLACPPPSAHYSPNNLPQASPGSPAASETRLLGSSPALRRRR